MGAVRVLLMVAAMLATSLSARAQTAAECEGLAAALGPSPEPAALVAAQAACAIAVREQPGSLPVLHLYARTLELSGDLDGAARLYQWAADDGYGPAVQALARLAGEPAEAVVPGEEAATETAAAAAEDLGEDSGPAQTAQQLERLAALLQRARSQLPRTTFDPAAVVAAAGAAPATLAQWVETHTALVPYRGRLRGPVGVLMDRYGNSLDRSLLLAALLEAAGHEAVLVHGTLPEADAARLLAVRPAPPPIVGDGTTLDAVLAQLGIDPADDPFGLSATMTDGAEAAAEMRDQVAAQTRTQGDALLGLVAGIAAPAASRPGEIEALRDHWWVRVRSGESWTDLDPSGAFGAAPNPETIEPTALPPELSHAVTLTVVAEFLGADGGLRSETLLNHSLLPADVAGTPVMLWHEPITVPGPDELLAAGDAAATERALVEERSWQPALLIGDEVFTDQIVTVDGTTFTGDSAGVAAARLPFAGISGGISDLFSGLGEPTDGTAAEEGASASDLIAMWLEVEITAPGLEAIVHRRAIFDLVGASARATGEPVQRPFDEAARRTRAQALLEQIDIGIWGATPSRPFVADVMARDLAPLFAEVAAQLRRGPDAPAVLPEFGALPRSQILPYGFAFGRAGIANSGPLIIDHPNVLLLRQGTRLAVEGSAAHYAQIDIVENGVAQVAAPAGGAFAARLRQGIADTALETAMLGSPQPSHNASSLFAADIAAGRAWVAVARPEDLDRLSLPDDVSAQIAEALGDGYLAVAPPTPSTGLVAWWRIDAATGTTLGMGATGAGSEFVEYLTLLGKVIGLAGCAIGGYDAMQNVSTNAGAAATGAAYALCVMGTGFSIIASFARILFVTSPMTAAAAAANAAAWAGPDAIGALAGAGGGLILGILGL